MSAKWRRFKFNGVRKHKVQNLLSSYLSNHFFMKIQILFVYFLLSWQLLFLWKQRNSCERIFFILKTAKIQIFEFKVRGVRTCVTCVENVEMKACLHWYEIYVRKSIFLIFAVSFSLFYFQVMSEVIVKCRQCRRMIAEQRLTTFLTAHGKPVADIVGCSLTCDNKLEDVWYLDEHTMPDWIRAAVEEVGKLKLTILKGVDILGIRA